MDLGLSGKRAIVCGASRGLGLACAEALAAEGADLLICSRDFDRIFAAARSIAETCGTTCIPFAAGYAAGEELKFLPSPICFINCSHSLLSIGSCGSGR